MTAPRIVDVAIPRAPEAVVVVLHGGGARPGEARAVSATQLSVLRMVPVARRVARAGRGRLAVARLLNSTRGWNPEHTPVADATWAMDRLRDRLGDLPVGLVGHSLGGRAALLAAIAPPVRGVVALNPWVYPDDDVDLSGRRVLVVHGTADRIADPGRSRSVAERIGARTDVRFVDVPGATHAMLRQGTIFEKAAASFLVETLLSDHPG